MPSHDWQFLCLFSFINIIVFLLKMYEIVNVLWILSFSTRNLNVYFYLLVYAVLYINEHHHANKFLVSLTTFSSFHLLWIVMIFFVNFFLTLILLLLVDLLTDLCNYSTACGKVVMSLWSKMVGLRIWSPAWSY